MLKTCEAEFCVPIRVCSVKDMGNSDRNPKIGERVVRMTSDLCSMSFLQLFAKCISVIFHAFFFFFFTSPFFHHLHLICVHCAVFLWQSLVL